MTESGVPARHTISFQAISARCSGMRAAYGRRPGASTWINILLMNACALLR